MGHPPRVKWVQIEHELFDRVKYKKDLADDEPVFTLDDLGFISDKVSRECWKNCVETIEKVMQKEPERKMGTYDTKWIRDKVVLVLRPLLNKAIDSFKQKKGIK